MDWTAEVDGYCERLGPGLWAEPLNALSNLAFLVGAVLAWRAAVEAGGRRLALALALVGVASGLFHTLATAWAGAADAAAIGLFAILYLDAAVRDFLGWRGLWRLGGGAGYALFLAVGSEQLASAVPSLGANAAYIAIAALLFGWGIGLRPSLPLVGRGLVLAALLLAVSIAFRMLDLPLCPRVPFGTHWLWHLLNAVVLFALTEVRRRHLEAAGAGR